MVLLLNQAGVIPSRQMSHLLFLVSASGSGTSTVLDNQRKGPRAQRCNFWELHYPGKLTWNLKISHVQRKIIFQTSIIVFHVNFFKCVDKSAPCCCHFNRYPLANNYITANLPERPLAPKGNFIEPNHQFSRVMLVSGVKPTKKELYYHIWLL